MACPYFHPLEPSSQQEGLHLGVLPLGNFWNGSCHADPQHPFSPGRTATHRLCNLGYARGSCAYMPTGDGPDAVRFTVRSETGSRVVLYYVIERDHRPFAHGPLEYDTESHEWTTGPIGEALACQARAYVESFQRRKSEASGA
jgi:hypothetical protein